MIKIDYELGIGVPSLFLALARARYIASQGLPWGLTLNSVEWVFK